MQLVQAFCVGDRRKHLDFCHMLQGDMEDDKFFLRLIFSDEAMFHLILSCKVLHRNVRIWGLEKHINYSMSEIHHQSVS